MAGFEHFQGRVHIRITPPEMRGFSSEEIRRLLDHGTKTHRNLHRVIEEQLKTRRQNFRRPNIFDLSSFLDEPIPQVNDTEGIIIKDTVGNYAVVTLRYNAEGQHNYQTYAFDTSIPTEQGEIQVKLCPTMAIALKAHCAAKEYLKENYPSDFHCAF